MKRSLQLLLICGKLLIISVWINGCEVTRNQNFSTNPTDDPTPILTVPLVIQATPAFVLPTLNTTSPPIVSSTPILLHTLDRYSKDKIITEMIQTNGGCRLPCLFGIMPGKTEINEAIQILYPLFGEYLMYSMIVPTTIQGKSDENIEIEVNFPYIENRVIKSISLNTETVTKQEVFSHIWENFAPHHIVQEYGKPSRVFLSISNSPYGVKDKRGYTLWVIYDQKGFLISYVGACEYKTKYHFCPKIDKEDINHISIYLKSPDDPTPLEELDRVFKDLHTPPFKVLSFEEVTGKSLDAYYQLFSQNNDFACFDSPVEIWNDN